MRRRLTITTCGLTLALVLGAAGATQAVNPEPTVGPMPGTTALGDRDWCDRFTEGGSLMAVDVCQRQVHDLLGNPASRAVPESLLPLSIFLQPQHPRARRFRVKGRGSRDSKPFTIPGGVSYDVRVTTKGCGPRLWARMRDADYVAPPDTLDTVGIAVGGGGAKLWEVDEGEYRLKVMASRKAAKTPCRWTFTFEPIIAADYLDLEGYLNTVIVPIPED